MVSDLMAGEYATVARSIIRNRSAIVLSDYVRVEVYQALARNTGRYRSYAMPGMTDRTGETVIRYVIAVLQEAGVTHHVGQVMALGAHAIWPAKSHVGIRK